MAKHFFTVLFASVLVFGMLITGVFLVSFFAIYAEDHRSVADTAENVGLALLFIGPIGFIWFFCKKLGWKEWGKWLAEYAWITTVSAILFFFLITVSDELSGSAYPDGRSPLSLNSTNPLAYEWAHGMIVATSVTLPFLTVWFGAKRYAKRRKKFETVVFDAAVQDLRSYHHFP